MSDKWMSLPVGRRLEQLDYDPHVVGELGPLRRVNEPRLRLARKNAREIEAENLEGEGRFLLDKSSGEQLEVVVSFVDWIDLAASGVVAFTVRDSMIVPLRPIGWKHKADESHYAGEIGGREATGREPMPLPAVF